MYQNKKVLLIAGGGALGTYVGKELLRLGAAVDVICPEDKVSDHPKLTFHQNLATREVLEQLFAENHYDGIVNFLHYPTLEGYREIYPFLMANTDHLIFLSSYRVYANEQHPITETAPRLADVLDDPQFFAEEKYALPKSRCEDYLRSEHKGENWTIVRPVISFANKRLDLLTSSGDVLLKLAREGKTLLLPETKKDFTAGIDWAGNSGKLIANLLFKKDAIGETFTIYSGHGLTWGDVAEIYKKHLGLKVEWVSEEAFLENRANWLSAYHRWCLWHYDRKFERDIDPSKVLSVTGLQKSDFTTVEDGVVQELKILGML